MKENIIQKKSFSYALEIINFYKYLIEVCKEFVISKQILRSGTSIGANVEVALGAQSRKDFFSKLTIAYKEARETRYWLRLLIESKYIDLEKGNSLLIGCEELLKIIGSIQKTVSASDASEKFVIRNS